MEYYLDKVEETNKEILFRLLEYSLFEESLTDGNEMNREALFDYPYFDSYFSDSNRYAFFIREKESNKLLGFVMINDFMKVSPEGHSIAEFMIIPKYRNQNIGKRVAFECFEMLKGSWEVSPSYGSESAYAFWKKVIEEYTNGNYEIKNGIFVFNNKKET